MNCPACGTPIPPALITSERQRELAQRPRKQPDGTPYTRPGAQGKPKPRRKRKDAPAWAWQCVECGADELSSAVPEADLWRFACGNCGSSDFRRVELPAHTRKETEE